MSMSDKSRKSKSIKTGSRHQSLWYVVLILGRVQISENGYTATASTGFPHHHVQDIHYNTL